MAIMLDHGNPYIHVDSTTILCDVYAPDRKKTCLHAEFQVQLAKEARLGLQGMSRTKCALHWETSHLVQNMPCDRLVPRPHPKRTGSGRF